MTNVLLLVLLVVVAAIAGIAALLGTVWFIIEASLNDTAVPPDDPAIMMPILVGYFPKKTLRRPDWLAAEVVAVDRRKKGEAQW